VFNNKNKPIRILLANNQELVIAGVQLMFQSEPDLELVGIANSFEESFLLAQQYCPDIILFDCMLEGSHCIERIQELLSASPSSKILILTACLNQERHLLALRQGAIGVFLLNQPIALLLKAIHKVYSGEVWLTNSLANELLKGSSQPAPEVIPAPISNPLTPRELTIARLLAQGHTAKQIAEQLFISEKTIRNQLVIIYSKLGIHNHVELVLHASRLGVQDASL
jgi:DNA-binding NarL/FixJ family response regulator